jgi:hypothetical protein
MSLTSAANSFNNSPISLAELRRRLSSSHDTTVAIKLTRLWMEFGLFESRACVAASRPYSEADRGVTLIGVTVNGLDLGVSWTTTRFCRFDAGVVSVLALRLVDLGPKGEDEMVLMVDDLKASKVEVDDEMRRLGQRRHGTGRGGRVWRPAGIRDHATCFTLGLRDCTAYEMGLVATAHDKGDPALRDRSVTQCW